MDQKIIKLVEGAAEKIMLAYELRKVSPKAMPQYLPAIFDDHWKSRSKYSCLTGNAQMAIIWLKLYQKNGDARLLNAALKIIDQLKQKQNIDSPNEGIKGAIPGSNPIWGKYFKYYYPNWATNFFADAIMLQESIMYKLEKG